MCAQARDGKWETRRPGKLNYLYMYNVCSHLDIDRRYKGLSEL